MRKSALPVLAMLTLALAGCSSAPPRPDVAQAPVAAPSSPTIKAAKAPAAALPAAGNESSDAVVATDAPVVAPTAQRGLASWYGPRFQGRRTASGERFDMHALTAAHLKLPLGSYARVTLLSTGKSVVVRITDRGPHMAHRVIDLSRAAAVQLGLLKRGVGEVAVQQVAPPDQVASAQ
ncbi:MAG TPA: septal ring lytic transglycosylase RlpA family protein [Rhodoferax sp.]|nr:septal ring lytic transglycosylase RlpA family protein [Rhodoferax sp.]